MVARRSIRFRLERVAVENRHGFAPTVQHTHVSKNPYAAPLIQYTEQGSVAVRENPESYKGEILKDRKSTRLNSSHGYISYAVFCLKKKKKKKQNEQKQR